VGKTTFSALLIRTLDAAGKKVLAIDADPDANLASAVGVPNAESIVPISEMKDMVYERTESKPGSIGGFFKLNPKVDDLPDSLSARLNNIKLMRLGGVKKGGAGCICPESTLLKALVTHVILGRGTAQSVDRLVVVVEPGQRSIETARHVQELASQIHLTKISVVGNKVRGEKDEAFLREHLADFDFLGFLPFDNAFMDADLTGKSPFDLDIPAKAMVKEMAKKLGCL